MVWSNSEKYADAFLAVQPINTSLEQLAAARKRGDERMLKPVPDWLKQAVKEARKELIANKTRELERERRGEILPRTIKRRRKGPPAHILAKMTAEEKEMDRVVRNVSEVGYVAMMKRKMGMKMRDPDAWRVEVGCTGGEEGRRLKKLVKDVRTENERRRISTSKFDYGLEPLVQTMILQAILTDSDKLIVPCHLVQVEKDFHRTSTFNQILIKESRASFYICPGHVRRLLHWNRYTRCSYTPNTPQNGENQITRNCLKRKGLIVPLGWLSDGVDDNLIAATEKTIKSMSSMVRVALLFARSSTPFADPDGEATGEKDLAQIILTDLQTTRRVFRYPSGSGFFFLDTFAQMTPFTIARVGLRWTTPSISTVDFVPRYADQIQLNFSTPENGQLIDNVL